MSDLIFLTIVVAFFAMAVGLMRACAFIIGPDEPATATTTAVTTEPADASA